MGEQGRGTRGLRFRVGRDHAPLRLSLRPCEPLDRAPPDAGLTWRGGGAAGKDSGPESLSEEGQRLGESAWEAWGRLRASALEGSAACLASALGRRGPSETPCAQVSRLFQLAALANQRCCTWFSLSSRSCTPLAVSPDCRRLRAFCLPPAPSPPSLTGTPSIDSSCIPSPSPHPSETPFSSLIQHWE